MSLVKKKNTITSGKTTRESSCNALPLAYHNSSHYVSNNINRETIMDKIARDAFSLTLVVLCCFSAFIANIIHSVCKLSPSDQCTLQMASIIGPVEQFQCPFPIFNSILRISISSYLFFFLVILIIIYGTTKTHPIRLINFTVNVLSLTHYLIFISLTMDCYSIYTAIKFSQCELKMTGGIERITITLNNRGQGTDVSKTGLFTVLITNLLVLLSCATMKYMIEPWYKQIEEEQFVTSSDTKNYEVFAPIEVRGKTKVADSEKIQAIVRDNYHHFDCNQPGINSNSNSSLTSRECSASSQITHFHSDDVNIINIIPNKEIQIVRKQEPIKKMGTVRSRDHGYMRDNEESLPSSILSPLDE